MFLATSFGSRFAPFASEGPTPVGCSSLLEQPTVRGRRLTLDRSSLRTDLQRIASVRPPATADPALARAAEAWWALRRQAVAALPALLAGAIAVALGARWGPALLAAAGAVELVLACMIAFASGRLREAARESIIAGRDERQLAAVAREHRRLLQPRLRASLARALEEQVRLAERWHSLLRPYRPVFDPRLVRATSRDLLTVAQLLRSRPASTVAVALVERLLTAGGSPLYGDDLPALQAELARILRHLEADHPAAPS
jgi:hypothetical protein